MHSVTSHRWTGLAILIGLAILCTWSGVPAQEIRPKAKVKKGTTVDQSSKAKGNGKKQKKSSNSRTKKGQTNRPSKKPPSKADVEWVWSKPARLWFAKTETTVAQYRACVDAGACRPRHHREKSDDQYCNWGYSDRDDHPMNCVDYWVAVKFCEWSGGRLPTEKEWYAEASDGGKRKYPWGDEQVNCYLAIWRDASKAGGCGKDRTWPVCSQTEGNSVSGLCDMSGNLWEWTSTPFGVEPAKRILRGGGFYEGVERLLATSRASEERGIRKTDIGFRCVRGSRP